MYSEFFLTLRTLPCHAAAALKNAHYFALVAEKTANNSGIDIGSIMVFGGILEGVWLINNQKKFSLCDFRCQSIGGMNE